MRQKLLKNARNCVVFVHFPHLFSKKIFEGGGLGDMAPCNPLDTLRPLLMHIILNTNDVEVKSEVAGAET